MQMNLFGEDLVLSNNEADIAVGKFLFTASETESFVVEFTDVSQAYCHFTIYECDDDGSGADEHIKLAEGSFKFDGTSQIQFKSNIYLTYTGWHAFTQVLDKTILSAATLLERKRALDDPGIEYPSVEEVLSVEIMKSRYNLPINESD